MDISERTSGYQGVLTEDQFNSWQANVARECNAAPNGRCRASGTPQTSEPMPMTDMSTRPITDADLQGLTPDELRVLRNVPYAEHGRQFASPDLNDLFSRQPWYHPDPSFKDSDLTPLETRNIDFLHVQELDQDLNGARKPYDSVSHVPQDTTGLLFPDSDSRALTDGDLSNLTDKELSIARNEIFARHGHQFKSPDLKQRFESLPWYQPNQAGSAEKLSYIEDRNVEFIQFHEIDRQLNQ